MEAYQNKTPHKQIYNRKTPHSSDNKIVFRSNSPNKSQILETNRHERSNIDRKY